MLDDSAALISCAATPPLLVNGIPHATPSKLPATSATATAWSNASRLHLPNGPAAPPPPPLARRYARASPYSFGYALAHQGTMQDGRRCRPRLSSAPEAPPSHTRVHFRGLSPPSEARRKLRIAGPTMVASFRPFWIPAGAAAAARLAGKEGYTRARVVVRLEPSYQQQRWWRW